MVDDAVQRIREICMALPGAEEKPFGGHTAPSFRVRDKLFVMISEDLSEMTLKALPGAQKVLVGSNPARFFVPRYVGHKGWIGIRLDAATDWDEVAGLIAESHAMTAPKRNARRG
ncbi:MAG: phosphoribosylglycinamide formyltransferase [Anaerolinea sp.]|nr:phosphoribosylglycinamide formyltransferase [Anaerolinea sp.]